MSVIFQCTTRYIFIPCFTYLPYRESLNTGRPARLFYSGLRMCTVCTVISLFADLLLYLPGRLQARADLSYFFQCIASVSTVSTVCRRSSSPGWSVDFELITNVSTVGQAFIVTDSRVLQVRPPSQRHLPVVCRTIF